MNLLKMYSILKMGIFHGYVWLPEGNQLCRFYYIHPSGGSVTKFPIAPSSCKSGCTWNLMPELLSSAQMQKLTPINHGISYLQRGRLTSFNEGLELHLYPGIPTTIKTMGVNITTIVYLRVLIIQIGSTIILMVVEAQGIYKDYKPSCPFTGSFKGLITPSITSIMGI